ncbi:imm11 family protein [Myxococcus llanfairpwllgwyngyllgogerychwyrndrobwllllantysiliogogogochensis]|uniref:imm11 family protein n=1 Tax=Myxococcus llanfairpwllgwyngyllgogerychwyrndrobwllllantysiliogogogochensis TaxID=2590453 RepID=UPI0015F11729|nr:DUF1629 domain-containing protein [Myxococcus llanfairpwllgwyngyllgogerychwyrndrobwllllantysiliogogogochensis]
MFRRLTQALRLLARSIPGPSSDEGSPRGGEVPSEEAPDRARRAPAARRASQAPDRAARYFDLHDDFRNPARRELSDPLSLDGRKMNSVWFFTSGAAVPHRGRLKLTAEPPGRPLDFSLAGAGLTPIVHASVAAIFRELAPDDVQLIPVEVEREPESFFILVATRLVRCLDETACAEVSHYTAEDGPPERVGHYRTVRGLRIDPVKTEGARVLRTWGWPVSLIVSEGIKEALEHAGVSGVRFAEVTPPAAPRKRRRKSRSKPRRG